MLTIYNFSLHKSPQQGYDRQKKKCKTTISPLLTFNLKVGFTFSVLSPKACPYAMMHPHLLWLTKIIASGMKKALAGGGCEDWGRDYLMLF